MIAADRVAAVLLAAGHSTRFGAGDKLLAEIDGKPILRHSADTLARIGFGALIVVGRPLDGFETVINERPEDGQSRSIRLGVEAAGRSGAEAALIALGDMPFVGAAHYRRLLAVHESITASTLAGVAMPPALFGREHFGALKALTGDRGAKLLLAAATLVEGDPADLVDIDVPSDLSLPRPVR